MPRPVWRGQIAFGLVQVPVALYSAEQRTDLRFRMLDSRNLARVRYERVNEETGEEVPWSEIIKGFEYDSGSYVPLDDEDFRRAAPESSKAIELEAFVPRGAVGCEWYDKPYYLTPDKGGHKGYLLLRETLRRTDRIGIARVVIRTREHLAALIPSGDMLLLDLLRFTDELRDPAELDLPRGDLDDYGIKPREVDMAAQLVEAMSTDWRPQDYRDEYRARLLEWIQEKVQAHGEALPEPPAPGQEGAEVIDMMDLLKRSLDHPPGPAEAPGTRRSAASRAAGRSGKAPAAKRREATKTRRARTGPGKGRRSSG